MIFDLATYYLPICSVMQIGHKIPDQNPLPQFPTKKLLLKEKSDGQPTLEESALRILPNTPYREHSRQ